MTKWTRELADKNVKEFRREVLKELHLLQKSFKVNEEERRRKMKRKRIYNGTGE